MATSIIAAQTKTGRHFLFAGFAVLFGLAVLALWSGQAARSSEVAAQGLEHVQAQMTDVLFSVQQAETAQRGYLLTGNTAYLAPYQTAATAVPVALQGLAETADTAGLAPLVDAKMAEIAQTLALDQAGRRAAALALVQTNAGLYDMQNLRGQIQAMQAAATQHLTKIRTGAERNVRLFQVAALLSVLGTVLLASVALRLHRQQTTQLLELNDEFNRIFTMSSDIIAVADSEGRFRSLNPAWTQITGRAAAAGAIHYRDVVHPEDLPAAEAAFTQPDSDGTVRHLETRIRRLNNSYANIVWRIVPLQAAGLSYAIGRDVTEERARDEQLRQSQKMEIIGQLTGGIAHDFNNLLTVIMGSLELLQRSLAGADAKITSRIEAAMEGSRRAAALTHRLLAFARRQPLEPQPIDPNRLLSGMSELLHRVLGEQIALELVCAAGLWRVMADGHQLENAILNLAVNARDAMGGSGHLTIETQNAALDDTYVAGQADITPGQYVLIAVTDTGTGMTPEVAAKAFEPFFTTKAAGQGTGLGLAQVYGFMKQSNGHIKIYSELGQGTTIKLYLPRLRGIALPDVAAGVAAPPEAFRGQGETILLVEDEAPVRRFTTELLEDHGYKVIAAENAAEAMPAITSGQPIDLLFTDVVLTGAMNGRQLADVFLQRRPDTSVLFTTGYSHNAIIHHGRLDEGIEFIGKPFTATALAQKLRKILDRPGVLR